MDNFYNKGLFKHTLGFTGYSTNLYYTDTWSYINVDLSKLHHLDKLEEITIPAIIASDLKELKSIEAARLLRIKEDQERERELILEKERLKKLEAEEDRARQEKFEEEERIKQEELRMKEWERKFDEEQKIRDETLIKNFYEEKTEDNKNIDLNKTDNELNKNEISYENSDTDEKSK